MITLIDLFGVAVFAFSGALVAGLFAMLTALALRMGAIRWHWGFPVFRI